jgi:hypothetical protein
MDYLRNHCWCTKSHWDGKMFDCQIIVTLKSHKNGYVEDWKNLTHEVKLFSQEKYEEDIKYLDFLKEKFPDNFDEDYAKEVRESDETGRRKTRVLKPDVLQWLEDNIEDFKGGKGWCVGNNDYVVNDISTGLSIFMQRRKDAMKFIKTWSKWKKPINYCQYFTDVRKKLNLKTLKYEVV